MGQQANESDERQALRKPGLRGVPRLFGALGWSLAGLRSAWRHEEAFRLEVLLAVVLLPLALWVGDTGLEKAVLVGAVFLVLVSELINSSVESVVDRISEEEHILSKRAKDVCSAAVFLALVNVLVVWLLVLFG
jgi:diacylglycerol kinase (ATP)